MIIRRKVNRHFTTVPNEPITDEGLSFEALGLLTYLLSRPDNWRVCIEHLKGRGSIGRDKAYRLLVDLMNRGYIIRRQVREAESQQFGAYEYVVYDEPQRALEKKERGSEPLPENPETEPLPEKPLPAEPYPANQDHNKYLQITNSLREHSASVEAGADAPSVNALAWKRAKALIPEPKRRSLIGLWIKRAPSDEGKEKFRAIVRAAGRPGPAIRSRTSPQPWTGNFRRLLTPRNSLWRLGAADSVRNQLDKVVATVGPAARQERLPYTTRDDFSAACFCPGHRSTAMNLTPHLKFRERGSGRC